LTYDAAHHRLYAVNAGSDSVSVFAVDGDRLRLRQVVPSRGDFPVSVAAHGDLVAVLDAGGPGAVATYRWVRGRLLPVPGGVRSLGLANTSPPLFIAAPAQVGFDPSGRHLVVTTKQANTIEVWSVGPTGRLGRHVSNPSAGAVPFAFLFDRFGDLVVTEADASTTTTYRLRADGRLTVLTPQVPDGGAALCWATEAGRYVVGANAGSDTLSSYRTGPKGGLVLAQAVAAHTDAGPIDLTTAAGGRFVYVQAAVAGSVQGFRVRPDGSLALVATVHGLPAFGAQGGMEGIAAT
jgi:6-phosphogluconolactonase (cycloisomerase 2 family)